MWNLTVVVDAARWGRTVAAGTLPFLLASAERAGLDWIEGPDVIAGPWASGPFDRPMRHVTADCALLVGDAAGYYDPLTGQGIFRALHSAELAARNLDEALRRSRVSRSDLRPYEVRSRAAFTPGRAVQRAVEGVMSRSALRGPVMHRLAGQPELLSALLGVIGDLSPVRSLMRPHVLLAALGAGRQPARSV
jgi:2-polyprenyl-6-methoxyphenol hydroxylase-like FAD-dependent oxidoreductase